jgi:cobalt-zinc-cadmium efflux system outer membrane protein
LAFNLPQPIIHQSEIRLNGTAATVQPGSPAQGSPLAVSGPVLQVTQALNLGLINSPRTAAVRAQLDITKALYATAMQLPNPQMQLDNGYIAEQTLRGGAQTTFDPPWKLAFRLLSAKRQVKESKLEILKTLWQFRNDVRRAYTETVVAQEAYQTLSDLADLSGQLLGIAEKRLSLGDVPELDVMKARLANSQVQIDLEQGRRRVLKARQQLNIIMGSDIDRPVNVIRLPKSNAAIEKCELLPDFATPVPPLRDILQLAQANRLELKMITQQISIAQAQLYNAVGNIIPDPVLATGQSIAGNPPTGPKLFGFYMIMNFEVPLFTFSQGDILRLKATIRQYYRQYHSQENQIASEVSAAYNNLTAARERIRVYQQHVLKDSLEVANLARLSYQVGESDITSTMVAQQGNMQIRQQYLDAITAYQQAFTDLEQAVGEPLQ